MAFSVWGCVVAVLALGVLNRTKVDLGLIALLVPLFGQIIIIIMKAIFGSLEVFHRFCLSAVK